MLKLKPWANKARLQPTPRLQQIWNKLLPTKPLLQNKQDYSGLN